MGKITKNMYHLCTTKKYQMAIALGYRVNVSVNLTIYNAITDTGNDFPITLPIAELNTVGRPFHNIATNAIPHHGYGGVVPRRSIHTYAVSYGGITRNYHLIFNGDPHANLGAPALRDLNILPTPQGYARLERRVRRLERRVRRLERRARHERRRRRRLERRMGREIRRYRDKTGRRLCEGRIRNGDRCTRWAQHGRRFCWQH